MSNEFITYATLLSVSQEDKTFLQACMNEIFSYTTKRYAFIKKHEQLCVYDINKCDDYRRDQTFINHKNKVQSILDARYARAIDIRLQARFESLLECKKEELEQKTIKLENYQKEFIKAQTKYLNSKTNKLPTQKKNLELVDYWNNKINRIKQRINQLNTQIKDKVFPNVVFGGKKLFKKQFNSGVHFEHWKKEWSMRATEFFCAGSLSEEYGNKQFQMTLSKVVGKKVFFNMKIKVPYRLREQYGDMYIIENIHFPRGQELLFNNLKAHESYLKDVKANDKIKRKNKKEKQKNNQQESSCEKDNEQVTLEENKLEEKDNNLVEKNNEEENNKASESSEALEISAASYGCKGLSFLFKRKENGEYYLHVSINKDAVPIMTNDTNGVIAIDINEDNISMAEINKVGKLLHSQVFRFNFGKYNNSIHREQMINQALNKIIAYAKSKKKHIVMENLDFSDKKAEQIKGLDKDYNRMLHSLPYAKIGERLRVNCYDNGVFLDKVSPMYSSMLGKTLYTKKYGISTHEAAAYVLARRYYGIEEYYAVPQIDFTYKDSSCSLMIPVDIMNAQSTLKTYQFYKKLYTWLSKEFKAPSRFYKKRKPLPSSVVQPALTSI